MKHENPRRNMSLLIATALLCAAALCGCLAPAEPEDACAEFVGEDGAALSSATSLDYGREPTAIDKSVVPVGGPQPEPYLPPGFKWVLAPDHETLCIATRSAGHTTNELRGDTLPDMMEGDDDMEDDVPDTVELDSERADDADHGEAR